MNVIDVNDILENAKESKKQVKITMLDGRIIGLYFDMEDHYQYFWKVYDDKRIKVEQHTEFKLEEYNIDCRYITHIHRSMEIKKTS